MNPIDVQWGNPDRTLVVYTAHGAWEWNDLYDATREAHALLATVNHVVDSIVDVTNAQAFPGGSLWHARRMASARHPNSGRLVYVGGHSFIKAVFDVISRMYRADHPSFLYANTLDEAHALLRRETAEPVTE
ncbi:MAG: hypothetical protein JW910_10845 [Anaerolineae bacterium]|nr:hypothetical protein [Anaerolineae bacterium]